MVFTKKKRTKKKKMNSDLQINKIRNKWTIVKLAPLKSFIKRLTMLKITPNLKPVIKIIYASENTPFENALEEEYPLLNICISDYFPTCI